MGELLSHPGVWTAIFGLCGVVVGALIPALTKRREQGLTEIQATVSVLKSEYDRLSQEVKALRAEMEQERKGRRQVQEKYSVSLTFIGSLQALWVGLKSRLVAAGVKHGEFPAAPDLIRVDLEQMTDPQP